MTTARTKHPTRPSRNVLIALAVVLLHVGLIWALQSGLLIRAAEMIVPAELLSQVLEPPAPVQASKPPPPPPKPLPPARLTDPAPAPTLPIPAPAPAAPVQPLAVPASTAPIVVPSTAPSVAAPPTAAAPTAPAAPAAAPNAAPAPAAAATAPVSAPPPATALVGTFCRIGPLPKYPPISRRLGETGKTLHHVFVGVDGLPQKAELINSSGYPRLDLAAQEALMKSRYDIRLDPGKSPRGQPQAVVIIPVPFTFQLSDGDSTPPERNTNESSVRYC